MFIDFVCGTIINMNKIVTASSNSGIGLWTSICIFFASIFGVESKNLMKKQNKVLDKALARLLENISTLGNFTNVSDFRVTWQGKLAVTLSALVETSDQVNISTNMKQKEETLAKDHEVKENKSEMPENKKSVVTKETKKIKNPNNEELLSSYSDKQLEKLKKELINEMMSQKK